MVHDAFIKFTPDSDEGERGVGYLYRIVRNLAFDALKRRRVESRAHLVEPPEWTRPAGEASPEQYALHRDELRLVARALAGMPPEHRTALEMYRFEGCTLEEIATRLGVSVPTAHRNVRAALASIAEALNRAGT